MQYIDARTPAWWLAGLAAVVLLAGGALILLHGFDGLYGQDPFAYFAYAMGPVRESLLAARPPPPFFWPPGYPLPVALLSFITGPTPLAGQLISLAAGALIPVFTFLLCRELRPQDGAVAPLVAGLLAAFTGQLWQSSTVVMSDTTALACATAGAWSLARYGRSLRLRWLLLAAAALAWATITRWIYGLVAVPCTAYALLVLWHSGGRKAAGHAAAAALVTGLILGPVLLAMVASRSDAAAFGGNFQVYSWHPARFFGRAFMTADGLLRHELPNVLYYGLAPARWAYFTPLLAPLILPGIAAVVRRRDAAALLILLGWAGIVFAFHIGAPYQNFRFTLAFLPPLAVLAGIGTAWVARVAGARRSRRTAIAACLLLAGGLGLMAAAGTHATRVLIGRKDDSVAAVRWVESRLPPDARIATFGLALTFRHYASADTYELYELDPAALTELLEDPRPLFLFVDTAGLHGQWRDLAPGTNYRWLERGPGLTAAGDRGAYTLFRVGCLPPPPLRLRQSSDQAGRCSG
ncbi:MAG: glycosyltransferase family 39 protein [Gemmatimonadota bacterium]